MDNISDTGERIIPGKTSSLMFSRHFRAYEIAKDYIRDKTVLEIGCGEGYGAHYLSGFCKNITGIDYNAEVVLYAKNKYTRDNLAYRTVKAENLSAVLKQKFDVIVSFQVIEHIEDTAVFLETVKSLLNDNGMFICSTPNRLDASPDLDTPANRFHVREFLADEYCDLLKRHFKEVKVIGLKRGKLLNFYRRLKKTGIFNFLPLFLDPVKKFYSCISSKHFTEVEGGLETALDFIAFCGK